MKPVVAAAGIFSIMIVAGIGGFVAHQSLSPADGPGVVRSNPDPTGEVLGKRRPDFSLPDLEGQMRSLDEWDGKLIVINFWATWCPPCREEIPVFMELQEEFADRGLQFLGIALQEAEEVRDYVNEMGMNYPVLTGYREVIKIAAALGNYMGALPYTVVINREGVIEFVKAGPVDLDTARSTLLQYL